MRRIDRLGWRWQLSDPLNPGLIPLSSWMECRDAAAVRVDDGRESIWRKAIVAVACRQLHPEAADLVVVVADPVEENHGYG